MRLASVQKMSFTFDTGKEDIRVFQIDNPCTKDDFPTEVFRGDFCKGDNINTDCTTALTAKLSLVCCMTGFSAQQNRLPGSGCTG